MKQKKLDRLLAENGFAFFRGVVVFDRFHTNGNFMEYVVLGTDYQYGTTYVWFFRFKLFAELDLWMKTVVQNRILTMPDGREIELSSSLQNIILTESAEVTITWSEALVIDCYVAKT